jgi:multimeric flavodoxin WrbA
MEQKKILAIVATKRKKGIVSTLAEKMLAGAAAEGHATEVINLYDYKLDYCIGCWACEKNGQCVLKDDFGTLFEKVKAADALVLASPVYWSNVPGIMKTFIDRQCGSALSHGDGTVVLGKRILLEMGPRPGIAGKKAVLITACTAPWPYTIFVDESRSTINAMRNYTRKIKAAIVAKLVFTDTRFLNVKGKMERYEKKAFTIGQKIF